MLADVRRRRTGSALTAGPPDRPGSASASACAPTGSAGPATAPGAAPGQQLLLAVKSAGPPPLASSPSLASSSGRRRPNYDAVAIGDLFLMSHSREALTARMKECMAKVVAVVATEEEQLLHIFSFYAELGKVGVGL